MAPMKKFAADESRGALVPAAAAQHLVESVTERSQHRSAPVVCVDSSLRRFLDNRLLVVGLMLLTGPLGLPALWLNRRFSATSKILGTIGFMLLTIVLQHGPWQLK